MSSSDLREMVRGQWVPPPNVSPDSSSSKKPSSPVVKSDPKTSPAVVKSDPKTSPAVVKSDPKTSSNVIEAAEFIHNPYGAMAPSTVVVCFSLFSQRVYKALLQQ